MGFALLRIRTVKNLVLLLIYLRSVGQILHTIVALVAVEVPDLPSFRWTQKSSGYQNVNAAPDSIGSPLNVDLQISVLAPSP